MNTLSTKECLTPLDIRYIHDWWTMNGKGHFNINLYIKKLETMNKKIIGYNAIVKFKDTQDEQDVFIKVGEFKGGEATEQEQKDDERVFYYLDTAEEIAMLMCDDGVSDFVVLSAVPVYNEQEEKENTVDKIKVLNFPNGFASWQETHFEIVDTIMLFVNSDDGMPRLVSLTCTMQGRGGLYELAETLTNKFEERNEHKDWDGDFFDAIQEFLNEELK